MATQPVAIPQARPASEAPVVIRGVRPSYLYVKPGQDLLGYQSWVRNPDNAAALAAYSDYLYRAGVGDVVPIWQLARTASQWSDCGQPPYEVPPVETWPNIVNTLRFVRDQVIPAVGEVEVVSSYRNPVLNKCAGGSSKSVHMLNTAVDLTPIYFYSRSDLMSRLCTIHARAGRTASAGLGFYVGLRFHIDTWKYRAWGISAAEGGNQCAIALERREEAREAD